MTARRMTGWRLVLVAASALALGTGAALAGPARAGDAEGAPADLTAVPRALASNGAIVAMPPVEGLSCRGMGQVLDLIDQTRYRGPAPVPLGHPDREIFEYEHRLAAAYYRGCINAGHMLDDPATAFGRGFEAR